MHQNIVNKYKLHKEFYVYVILCYVNLNITYSKSVAYVYREISE